MDLLHHLELLLGEVNLPLHLGCIVLRIYEKTVLGCDDVIAVGVLSNEKRDENLFIRTT